MMIFTDAHPGALFQTSPSDSLKNFIFSFIPGELQKQMVKELILIAKEEKVFAKYTVY